MEWKYPLWVVKSWWQFKRPRFNHQDVDAMRREFEAKVMRATVQDFEDMRAKLFKQEQEINELKASQGAAAGPTPVQRKSAPRKGRGVQGRGASKAGQKRRGRVA
jgi:hypothetical protein